MKRDGRSSSHDPTAEPQAPQSTQTASGLSGEHHTVNADVRARRRDRRPAGPEQERDGGASMV